MCGMLALSLAFFGGTFVSWLPWFSGLILGSGCVRSGWVLGTLWVPLCVLTRADALVGFS